MGRRPPPSSLRFVQGPTPPRNTPKHTLPSAPRPVFQPTADTKQSTVSRSRSRSFLLPWLGTAGSGTTSEKKLGAQTGATAPRLRGPWDHSGCIKVSIDVESVLAPLKPAAVTSVLK